MPQGVGLAESHQPDRQHHRPDTGKAAGPEPVEHHSLERTEQGGLRSIEGKRCGQHRLAPPELFVELDQVLAHRLDDECTLYGLDCEAGTDDLPSAEGRSGFRHCSILPHRGPEHRYRG